MPDIFGLKNYNDRVFKYDNNKIFIRYLNTPSFVELNDKDTKEFIQKLERQDIIPAHSVINDYLTNSGKPYVKEIDVDGLILTKDYQPQFKVDELKKYYGLIKEQGFFDKAWELLSIDGIANSLRKYEWIDDNEDSKLNTDKFKTNSTAKVKPTDKYTFISKEDTLKYPNIIQNGEAYLVDYGNKDIPPTFKFLGNKVERQLSGSKPIYDVKLISDFLLDHSIKSGFQHPYATSQINNLKAGMPWKTKPENNYGATKFVFVIEKKPDGTGVQKIVRPSELKGDEIVLNKRQMRLSDVKLDNMGNIKLETNKDFKERSGSRGVIDELWPILGSINTINKTVPLNTQTGLGAFEGGAATLISENGEIIQHINGSISDIINQAQKIKKDNPGDVYMYLADVGSFSKKPVLHNNTLTTEQQNQISNYNPKPYVGAALLLTPTRVGKYKVNINRNGVSKDTTFYTANPNNEILQQLWKQMPPVSLKQPKLVEKDLEGAPPYLKLKSFVNVNKLGGKLIPKHQQGKPILYNRPIAEYSGKPIESLIYTDAMLKGATPEQLEAYEILGKADSQCSKSSGIACEKAWNKLRAVGLYAPDSYESFKKSMKAKQISLGNKPTINWETGQVIDTEQFDAETDSWNILGKGKQLGWEIHDIGSKDFDKTKFLEALKNLPIGATLHSGSYSDSSKQTLNQKEGFSNVSHTMRVVGFSERGNPIYYDFGTLKELTLDDYDMKRIRAIAIPTEFKDYTYRNLLNYQPTTARKKGGSLIPKNR